MVDFIIRNWQVFAFLLVLLFAVMIIWNFVAAFSNAAR
jgi:hypothetical protein